ncbi:hypothetical protein VNO77_08680 [Canavalia gladiata]|uniref:Uncharacterized protein n=1 Tax=Canavalia gladiata TaxID=3824 RepID=A0AAN9M9D7_CANGL
MPLKACRNHTMKMYQGICDLTREGREFQPLPPLLQGPISNFLNVWETYDNCKEGFYFPGSFTLPLVFLHCWFGAPGLANAVLGGYGPSA